MAVAAPGSGPTGLGSKNFEDLGACGFSQSGTAIKVTGTLKNATDWTEFSSDEKDRTGWYLACKMTGDEGAYIAGTTPQGKRKVQPLAECAEGYAKALKKGQKSFTITAYPDKGKAEANTGGTKYTFDLSGVTYGE